MRLFICKKLKLENSISRKRKIHNKHVKYITKKELYREKRRKREERENTKCLIKVYVKCVKDVFYADRF